MKNVNLMSNDEKEEYIRTKILKAATSLHNACKTSYSLNNCVGCAFKVDMGCSLYGHPIEWASKLDNAKKKVEQPKQKIVNKVK
ncbi:hypothetical protein D3C81_06920 [compost metagenome]